MNLNDVIEQQTNLDIIATVLRYTFVGRDISLTPDNLRPLLFDSSCTAVIVSYDVLKRICDDAEFFLSLLANSLLGLSPVESWID